jgi:carboxypeptidase Taq
MDRLDTFQPTRLVQRMAHKFMMPCHKQLISKKAILDNNIKVINDWTKEHIHKFAQTKTPKEIMMIATNKPFDPMYYVNYLKGKYNK